MGCSSSNADKKDIKDIYNDKVEHKISEEEILDTFNRDDNIENKYKTYNFSTEDQTKSLIAYTLSEDKDSDFHQGSSINIHNKQTIRFKSSDHNIAIYYSKGSKEVNQDKFFLIIDDQLEVYCVVDGHGPYGEILAQITQNMTYEYFSENFSKSSFELKYESEFNLLFEKINKKLIEDKQTPKEEKMKKINENKYDAILSGCSLTIVVKIGTNIYQANVGNVLAYLWSYDNTLINTISAVQLSFNDSSFNMNLINGITEDEEEEVNNNANKFKTKLKIHHIIDPHLIDEEIRRVYEHKGEARNLSENGKCRIFMKGKYFPGIINTRSLGDLVASSIGCINIPHITKTEIVPGNKYYLLIISDGINDKMNIENFINTFQEKGLLLLESLSQAVTICKNSYQDTGYFPDMTGIFKEITETVDN